MKKINLLLFLFCIFSQSFLATAGNVDEKIDLSPKIKKRDHWKMVVAIGGVDYKWNFNSSKGTQSGLFKKFMSSQNSNLKFEWDINCLESTREKLVLQFALERYVDESKMISDNLDYFIYNDSEYPLTLNPEDVSKMKDVLGKSVVMEIPWNSDSIITNIRNDFERDQKYYFPAFTFQNRKAAKNYQIQFGSKQYAELATGLLNILMTQWRGVLPKSPVKFGDKWSSEFHPFTYSEMKESVAQKFELTGIDTDNAFIEVATEDAKDQIMIDRQTGWFSIIDESSSLRTFSYGFSGSNTHVSIDLGDENLSGDALIEITYPVGYKPQMLKVENGKFKLDLDLEEPVLAKIKFKELQSDIFLRPLMNVNVNWNSGKIHATGFGSEDINCVAQVFGEPLYLDYSTNDYPKGKIEKEVHDFRTRIDSIVNNYGSALSLDCKKYISNESEFRVAYLFVSALNQIKFEEYTTFPEYKPNDINRLQENKNYFREYLDTLQINGNISLCSRSYHDYIKDYLVLEETEFLTQRVRRYDEDKFAENILFAGIQYVGYPYFYSVYDILKSEILKGNSSFIEKELDDFYNLPGCWYLKNSLQSEISAMEPLKPGNVFPVSEIKDMDGKIQKLPKGELCIVDLSTSYFRRSPQHKDELQELTRIITKDDRVNKINYVVIRPDFAKGIMVETPSNDTVNFIHIYLPVEDITTFNSFKLIDGGSRILLLDKDLKIVNNNIGKITYYSGHHLIEILNQYFESKNQPKLKADTRRLLLFILISLICFGFLSWLIIRVRTQKISKREAAKRKLSELELKAIRSQMNPHFIFNAMGSIQNLMNHNLTEKANLYLARFAKLMRMVLNSSNKKLVSLADELELIRLYLELEQLRVGFQFKIDVGEGVNPETEEIPGMLLQPFVENAVIHGITPKGEGRIDVEISKAESNLVCAITDDGVGIDPAKIGNGNGLAMKFAEKRVNLLSEQLKNRMKLEVENRSVSEGKSGTKVTLIIPVE